MTARLIGLGGFKRSGKDAAGDYLESKHDFVKMGMSDALNEAMLILNPWIMLDFNVKIGYRRSTTWEPVRYRDLHDAVGYVEAKKHSEVRRFLQILGTEVGRKMIDEQVWVRIAEKKIRDLLASGTSVVITAIRFPNELDMIKRLGGTLVWIDRDAEKRSEGTSEARVGEDARFAGKAAYGARGAAEGTLESHDSENSVSKFDFEAEIVNNSTLEDLYASLDAVLEDYTPKYWSSTNPVVPGVPVPGASYAFVENWAAPYDR